MTISGISVRKMAAVERLEKYYLNDGKPRSGLLPFSFGLIWLLLLMHQNLMYNPNRSNYYYTFLFNVNFLKCPSHSFHTF